MQVRIPGGEKYGKSAQRSAWRRIGVDMHSISRPMPALCELCGLREESGRRLALDHCHATRLFRGWLCKACNTALGLLKDNPVLMDLAASYVRRGGAAIN